MSDHSITIKDIATALQLNISTVSRALNDHFSISERTRELVQQYAREHHYTPNLHAQGLKNKRSRTIGISLPVIPNNFFAEVINGIESVARAKNYSLIITQNMESQERELQNIDNLSGRSVDGILASLSTETDDVSTYKKLQQKNVPIVFFDRVSSSISAPTVTVDNEGGAYEATTHLIKNGYKRIAHITSSKELSITKERLEGYHKALQKEIVLKKKEYIKYCKHGGMIEAELEEALDALLNMPEPPTAIFTASDRITIGTMALLKKRGIKIPQQMALAGFSNFTSPELFSPTLTVIRQPAFEMGKTAMEILIRLIENKKGSNSQAGVVLPVQLIPGESSARTAKK